VGRGACPDRLDGRARQKVIGTIAGFREADFDNRNGVGGFFEACLFWHQARARLKAFELVQAKHAAAVATLAAKVPEMSEEQISLAFEAMAALCKRQMRVIPRVELPALGKSS
jgi:hypothetical protein